MSKTASTQTRCVGHAPVVLAQVFACWRRCWLLSAEIRTLSAIHLFTHHPVRLVIHQTVIPVQVEEAMDELEDGLQTISEVQDVMTRELIAPGVDMSEVDAEFDALGSLEDTGPVSAGAGAAAVAAGAGASAAAAAPAAAQPQPHIPAMPQVPSHVPAQQQAAAAASMDDELAELAGL